MRFEFEGRKYIVPAESMTYAGDVVQLPDGRFLEILTLESFPSQVKEILVVEGPSNVPDPSGRGEHIGVAWQAADLEAFNKMVERLRPSRPEMEDNEFLDTLFDALELHAKTDTYPHSATAADVLLFYDIALVK